MSRRYNQAAFEELCGRIEVVLSGVDPDQIPQPDLVLTGQTYLRGLVEKKTGAMTVSEEPPQAAIALGSRAVQDSFPRINGVRIG